MPTTDFNNPGIRLGLLPGVFGVSVDPPMELILVPLLLGAYFLPTVIAFRRQHPACDGIFLTNLFAGWTGIGWLAVLWWAWRKRPH